MREVAVSQTAMTPGSPALAARLQDAGVDVMSATSAVMAALSGVIGPVRCGAPREARIRTSVPLVVAANDVRIRQRRAIARVRAGSSTGLPSPALGDPFGEGAAPGQALVPAIVTHADTAAIVDRHVARRR